MGRTMTAAAGALILAQLVPAALAAAPDPPSAVAPVAPKHEGAKHQALKHQAAKHEGVKHQAVKHEGAAKAADTAGAPPAPWMSVDPDRAARPDGAPPPHKAVVSHARPNDPVEIGGKWNGSNASSAQTRAENYNGDAAGTGGAVGLKLHF